MIISGKPAFLLAGLLQLVACQSTPDTGVVTAAPAQPAPVTTQPANPEYVEIDSVSVNGKLRESLSTRLLISQLGRPDSVDRGAVECGAELETPDNTNGDFWYYGRTMYEVAGTQAILLRFDVTTGKFKGKLGKLPLNQNTTLDDVRRFFTLSAKEAEKPASGRPEEEMGLPFFYKGVPLDASLILLFKKGRLQAVEFFNPC